MLTVPAAAAAGGTDQPGAGLRAGGGGPAPAQQAEDLQHLGRARRQPGARPGHRARPRHPGHWARSRHHPGGAAAGERGTGGQRAQSQGGGDAETVSTKGVNEILRNTMFVYMYKIEMLVLFIIKPAQTGSLVSKAPARQ